MGGAEQKLTGPDLAEGVAASELEDGAMILGHAGGEAVLLARHGDEVFAVGATCTHYGAPLVDGLVVGDTVRCPWHHACFSLRTGDALRAPALNPLACYEVEKRADKLHVLGRREPTTPTMVSGGPTSIVIVGAGAAGNAAAETLRASGFDGQLTMIGADPSVPYDRPNLSKDYLAGNAPEEWIPLRGAEFYAERRIELRLGVRALRIDVAKRSLALSDGSSVGYGALLLATGADPIRLGIPGADLPHVWTMRTLADSRAVIAAAQTAKRAVVIGASFIGLEVAASLRTRGLEVHVVAPEARPLERVMGPQIGDLVRAVHEEKGVVFHLGLTPASIDATSVTLSDGSKLAADVVVMGVGVRPSSALAEAAGLQVDRGVVVDAHLRTSAQEIFAAGDIARWPDPHSGQSIRVEHWVVAERQGQIAARNMLGEKVPCDLVPFFWSQHFDLGICYVGHAEKWDRIDVRGSLGARDATLAYRAGDKTLAVVTLGRDLESLRAELAFEEKRLELLAAM